MTLNPTPELKPAKLALNRLMREMFGHLLHPRAKGNVAFSVLVIIVFIIGTSALLRSSASQPTPYEPMETMGSQPLLPQGPVRQGYERYSNIENKIEFEYPSSWPIRGKLSPGAALQIENYIITDAEPRDVVYNAQIAIYVEELELNILQDEWAENKARWPSDASDSVRFLYQRKFVVDEVEGLAVVFATTESSKIGMSYHVAYNGLGYSFSFIGRPQFEAVFLDLLNSVHFVK